MVVWTNNLVAFAKDLIFGLVVMAEHGWHPVSDLDDSDFDTVFRSWGYASGNPYADELIKMYNDRLSSKQQ